ncbi:MAG: adenosine kinase [bacterium]|nr:adenosine kinase [bacterium]
MKKYNIYGIGNAIVDYEVEVSDEDLQKLEIKKGHMTLIQENEIEDLIAYFGKRLQSRQCGGSAANTMIGATKLGSTCFYSCKVANDAAGLFYFDDLTRNKVDTNLTGTSLKNGATGRCIVMVTPDAERTMTTFLGTTATFSSKELETSALTNSDYIYIEGYLAPSPPAKDAAIAARQIALENDVKVAITLSDPSMATYFKSELNEMIGAAPIDILFCNKEEALAFTGAPNLDAAKTELLKKARQVVITLGPDGALIIERDGETAVPGVPTKAVDSNGAGDGFAGAYLAAISQGKTPAEAAKQANEYAAKIVAKFGPRL